MSPRRRAVLLVAGALALAAAAWGAHRWWERARCDHALTFTLPSPAKHPLAPPLDPGNYTLQVTADERQTRCEFEVANKNDIEEHGDSCDGEPIRFIWRGGQIVGFVIASLPMLVTVRLWRDGTSVIDETVRPEYPERGASPALPCVRKSVVLTGVRTSP